MLKMRLEGRVRPIILSSVLGTVVIGAWSSLSQVSLARLNPCFNVYQPEHTIVFVPTCRWRFVENAKQGTAINDALLNKSAFHQKLADGPLIPLKDFGHKAVRRALGATRENVERQRIGKGLAGDHTITAVLEPEPAWHSEASFDQGLCQQRGCALDGALRIERFHKASG